MSELAKIEYLRVLLQANVIDHMHELMRIRAEAEAISSLDNGVWRYLSGNPPLARPPNGITCRWGRGRGR
jgi:hypothetical protein